MTKKLTVADIENLDTNHQEAWEIIQQGHTLGLFQIESNLGRHWAKLLRPVSIEELSALVALIRPGCLKAYTPDKDGKMKNMMEHFVDRKHGHEDVSYLHPALENILSTTQGVMIYQEQLIEIAKEIAGFNLQEADKLRKSVGKKDAKTLSEALNAFIDGCKTVGIINEDMAKEISDLMWSSARYSFNKCFHYNTLVERPDGSNIRIEELYQLGSGNYGEALSLTEIGVYGNRIVDVRPAGIQSVYQVVLENELRVSVTLNHKFPTPKGELPLSELKEGDELFIQDGNLWDTKRIREIRYVGKHKTYDVEMEAPYHNLVVNSGIIASNSHSVGYAKLAYWSAYLKANYPREFFCQYLRNAKDFKEIRAFVNDARMHGFEVCTPDLRDLRANFYIKDGKIYYGLTNIREVGRKVVEKIRTVYKKHNLAHNLTPYTSIIMLFNSIDKTSTHALINSGAVDFLGVSRTSLIYQYEKWSKLSDKEKEWIIANGPFESLAVAVQAAAPLRKEGGATFNKNRHEIVKSIAYSLQNPPTSLTDSQQRIIEMESVLLGISITHGTVDTDIEANSTCREFFEGQQLDSYVLSVCIDEVKVHTIKNGQQKGRPMAFLEVHDESGWIDNVVLFADAFEAYEHLLQKDNYVALRGRRGSKGLVVDKVKQI